VARAVTVWSIIYTHKWFTQKYMETTLSHDYTETWRLMINDLFSRYSQLSMILMC